MRLPSPPRAYDQVNEGQTRDAIERADAQSYKRGQDVEIGDTQRLIIRDAVTGERYRLTIESGQVTVRDLDGVQVSFAAVAPVVATADLPAADVSQDGRIVIEDAGTGDRNLVIYAGGERFRIDGGAAF